MKRSRYSEEQIIKVLHEGEAGMKVLDIVRKHGIAEQTYYRWKQKYGGMTVSESKRLKGLEDENRRLKQIVGDLTLDKQALEMALGKKW
jgi:putative transposase